MMRRMLKPGAFFADYKIDDKLGNGSYATVYKATDIETGGRSVALKVIHEYLAYDLQRFIREVEAVVRVDHPNVVKIYRRGQAATGELFIAMQLIEGGDLKQHLEQRDLVFEELLEVLGGAASGIDACHSCAVFHRDLKPANIMVSGDRRGVLTDFGIAKGPTLRDLTPQGAVHGTLDYLAPELFRPGTTADAKSDLYSFGVVVYEALTGSQPTPLPTHLNDAQRVIAVRDWHKDDKPIERPSARNPALDPALDAPILAALRRRADDRPRSATAYLAGVLAAIRATDLHETPTTKVRPSARRWVRPAAALIATCALSAGAVVAATGDGQSSNLPRSGQETKSSASGRPPTTKSDSSESASVFETQTYVRIDRRGSRTWQTTVQARPEDQVDVMIRFRNAGMTPMDDVAIASNLPDHLAYVSRSSWVTGGSYRAGRTAVADGVTTGGVTLRAWSPGQTGLFGFSARLDPSRAFPKLGAYNLRVVGIVRALGTDEFYNTAKVLVRVE